MQTPDDAELARAWRAGDRAAGQALVERHYDGIVRFFRTKAGAHADDLVQRVFLVVADPDKGFRGESSFRTYLFGVARNVLFAHYRGRTRDDRIDDDVSLRSVHDLAPGLSSVAAQRADERLLFDALQRIPIDIQMTLELFYWEDLSIPELAGVLEIPEGTVKSRLHRGRLLLEQAMERIAAPSEARESVRVQLGRWALQMQAAAHGDG
ncbi:MAG: sigma-70 family RNA polymerase sigma factor [Deltaproteobacteria bacterium]|nr:sigma-70 family RNA polymerase sigma factor [Deltaproteobacteria bacterium]